MSTMSSATGSLGSLPRDAVQPSAEHSLAWVERRIALLTEARRRTEVEVAAIRDEFPGHEWPFIGTLDFIDTRIEHWSAVRRRLIVGATAA